MGRPQRYLAMIRRHGWVGGGRRFFSPHADRRPPSMRCRLVVIHAISLPAGHYGGRHIVDLFCGRPLSEPSLTALSGLPVAAHLLIRRDGQLQQFVPLQQRAWHAGRSCYRRLRRCNDFSIGIELEGSDHRPFCFAQYRRLACLLQHLYWQIPALRPLSLCGHRDIARGRKSDPGPCFHWALLRRLLGHRLRLRACAKRYRR